MRRFYRVASAVAAACLLPNALVAQSPSAHKALVYCPASIDAVGCSNIAAALASQYPQGVDRGYDGTSGTVDLKTVDLWQYEVFLVPSLADGADLKPYALLRDATVAERLHDALMGRIAMWSGTPDLGTASSANRDQKNALIVNLATRAAANYATVKGPGLVTFLDQSEIDTDRYGWLQGIARLNVTADTRELSYASVNPLTDVGRQILTSGGALLSYSNMASFGLQLPDGGAGVSLDAIGQTGTSVGGQVVLLTSPGGNTAGAIVRTDKNDYAPGTTVDITGSGWQPGETVTLTLHEDPFLEPNQVFTTVADANGRIEYTRFAPDHYDINVRFILTAVGQRSSVQAQTTFTDGIAFVSSTVTSTTATGITMFAPSVAAGDLLIAQITVAGLSTSFICAPSGWTSLLRTDNASQVSAQLFYRVAGVAAAATPYSWEFRDGSCAGGTLASKGAAAGLARYSGVDGTNPINVSAADIGHGNSATAPSVTTTVDGARVLRFFGGNSGSAPTVPANILYSVGAASWFGAASDAAQTTAGATGSASTVASTSTFDWVAQTVALREGPCVAPSITAQPTGTTKGAGQSMSFTVAAAGSGLSYQWKRGTTNVGTNSDSYTINAVTAADAGDYTVVITGDCGSVTSSVATLTVTATNTIAVYVHAHEDDWQLFMGDRVSSSAQTADAVTFIFTTAGDNATHNDAFWQAREEGAKASVALLVGGTSTCSSQGINSHPIQRCVNGKATIYFMRLPDGGVDGTNNGGQTMLALENRVAGSVDIAPMDNSQTNPLPHYTSWQDFYTTVQGIIDFEAAQRRATNIEVHTAETDRPANPEDHPDHWATGDAVNAASVGRSWTITYYVDYFLKWLPVNIPDAAHTIKTNEFLAYDNVMTQHGFETLALNRDYLAYQARTYFRSMQTTPVAQAPSPASRLALHVVSESQINVQWFDNSAFETGFRVERAPDDGTGRAGTFATIATLPINSTTYSNTGLLPSTAYWYRIMALNTVGDAAAYTDWETATTLAATCLAPSVSVAPASLTTNSGEPATFTASVTGTQPISYQWRNGPLNAPVNINGATLATYSIPSTRGADAGSYSVVATNSCGSATSNLATLSVNRLRPDFAGLTAPLSITYGAPSVTLGGTIRSNAGSPTGSVSISIGGVSQPATISADGTFTTSFTTSALAASATPYVVTYSYAGDATYLDATDNTSTTLTVGKASQSITITSALPPNAMYGGSYAPSATGGASGSPIIFATTTPAVCTLGGANVQFVGTGTCTVTADQAGSTNFDAASQQQQSFSVSRAVASIAITNPNPTYDGTAKTAAIAVTGVNGATLPASAYSVTYSQGVTAVTSPRNAGSYAVAVAMLDANYTGARTGTLSITAKPLTITSVTVRDKTYDGTATATITGSTLGGIVNEDLVGLTVTAAAFGDKGVGVQRLVTVTGLGLAGNDAGNYSLAAERATGTASITPKTLTISAAGVSKPYDGSTSATVTLTDDRISGDLVDVTYSASFADKNVGTNKTVTIAGITLGGSDGANYSLASTPVVTTAAISARPITVAADPQTKVFGAPDPSLSYQVTAGSLVSGETLTGALQRAAGETVVGSPYKIQQGGLTAGTNYLLTFLESALTIVPASATITIDPATLAANFDGTPKAVRVTTSPDNAIASVTTTYAGSATPPTNAGQYDVVAALPNGNYTAGPARATLVIAPATQAIRFSTTAPSAATYGGSYSPVATGGASGNAVVFGTTTPAVCTVSNSGVRFVGIGDCVVTADQAGNTNYSAATQVIQHIAVGQAGATIAIADPAPIYDGAAKTAAITVKGPNGDALPVSSYSVTYTLGSNPVTTPTNAGRYSVAVSVTDPNYAGAQTGTLTIQPASLTPSVTVLNKPYDGTVAAAIATRAAHGVIGTDDVSLTGGVATFADKNVGTAKPVSVSGLQVAGANAGNYALASETATATASISPRALVITVIATNKVYDGSTAATVAFSDNRVTGDVLAVCPQGCPANFADASVGVGKLVTVGPITVSGTDATNYTFNATATATADITALQATINLTNLNQTYDGSQKSATATTNPSGLGVSIAYKQNNVIVSAPTNAGSYDVIAHLTATNYSAADALGTLVIGKAQQTITMIAPSSATYGDGSFAITANSNSGLGVSLAASGPCSVVGLTVTITGAGSCALTATQAGNGNYNAATPVSQTVTVSNPLPALATAQPVQPTTLRTGAGATSLTINGSGFSPDSKVRAGGTDLATTFLSGSQLRASVPATLTAASGTLYLSVFNAAPGGGATAPVSLFVLDNQVNVSASSTTTSTDPGGAAQAQIAGLTATASGSGTITVAQFDANPAGATTSFESTGRYFDIALQQPISFTRVTINFCDLNGGGAVEWWTGSAWQDVQPQGSVGTNGCIPITLDASSSPSLSDLTRTPFAIGKRKQTISFGSLSGKTFGDPAFAVTATSSSGLAISFSVGATDQCTIAGSLITLTGAGRCTVTASQGGGGGYSPAAPVAQTFNIAKATALITLSNLSQLYDGLAKQATASTSPSGLNVALAYSQNGVTVPNPTNVGSYTVVATVNDANYQGTQTGTLVVAQRTSTITLGNLNQTYDGSAKQPLVTTSPAGLAVTVTYNGTSLTSPTDAGSYSVVATINDANYQGTQSGTLTIAPAALTVTADAASKVYGAADPSLTYRLTTGALATGDQLSGALTRAAGETVVGSPYAIQQGTLSAGTNYRLAFVPASLTITQAVVTPKVTINDRPYDGTTSAVIASRTLVGVIGSSNVALTGGTASFADKNAGTAKPVTATGLQLTGPDAGNYSLGSTGATATASIARRPLTISPTGVNKVYDGTTSATVTLSDNRVPGDNLSASYATASFADANAGSSKPVTVSGISVTGPDADNYSANTTATTMATITQAPATITLGNLSQAYDGSAKQATATTDPAGLAVTITYSQNGNTVTPTNQGSYQVLATVNNPNYQGTQSGTLVITAPAVTTVTMDFLINNAYNIVQLSDKTTTQYNAAFLTTASFDATTVDPATVLLGDGNDNPADATVVRNADGTLKYSITDVNMDGKKDILLYFSRAPVQASGITTTTTQVVMRGQTKDGKRIKASDKIAVYP